MVLSRLGKAVMAPVLALLLMTSHSHAGPQYVDGAALSGYDAVAYQTDGVVIRGEPTITADWNGAIWRFATPAHAKQFQANPARYAPAYDGHCAYAVSEGRKSAGLPEFWQVAGGRLFLHCSKIALDKWTAEFDTRLARAEENWRTLEAEPASRPAQSPPS